MLFGWWVVVVIPFYLGLEAFIFCGKSTIAGVAPTVCPEDLSHFVHGLFACAANQVCLTFS